MEAQQSTALSHEPQQRVLLYDLRMRLLAELDCYKPAFSSFLLAWLLGAGLPGDLAELALGPDYRLRDHLGIGLYLSLDCAMLLLTWLAVYLLKARQLEPFREHVLRMLGELDFDPIPAAGRIGQVYREGYGPGPRLESLAPELPRFYWRELLRDLRKQYRRACESGGKQAYPEPLWLLVRLLLLISVAAAVLSYFVASGQQISFGHWLGWSSLNLLAFLLPAMLLISLLLQDTSQNAFTWALLEHLKRSMAAQQSES